MMLRICVIFLLVSPAASVADEYAKRRATCEPMVTALFDDCSVHDFYRCADGSTYVESRDGTDPTFAMLYNADFQVVYQRDVFDGTGIERVVSVNDSFSFTTLMLQGRDTASLEVINSLIPGMATNSTMVFETALTDAQETYEAGTFRVATTVETLTLGFAGNRAVVDATYLIDPARRVMIERAGAANFVGQLIPIPTVTDVVGPGSPYFMPEFPEQTCQDQLSFMTPDPALQVETTHDNL